METKKKIERALSILKKLEEENSDCQECAACKSHEWATAITILTEALKTD